MWRALILVFCLSLPAMAPATPPAATPTDLRIVVLGDMPYRDDPQTLRRYDELIEQINRAEPDVVIHVGDTKSGSAPCTDAVLRQRLSDLQKFHAPLLYTPGDNEWTDCHRKKAGRYDPRERLAFLRKTYFADPTTSFGQHPLEVASQAAKGYPENVRVRIKDTLFITAHVVGSNNNLRDEPAALQEYRAREAATVDWLQSSFAVAKAHPDIDQIVVAMQADMYALNGLVPTPIEFIGRSGFRQVAATLAQLTQDYGKPVLLVHGDTHRFRLYAPYPHKAPNLTVAETFGAPDINALLITLRPNHAKRYVVTPIFPPPTGK